MATIGMIGNNGHLMGEMTSLRFVRKTIWHTIETNQLKAVTKTLHWTRNVNVVEPDNRTMIAVETAKATTGTPSLLFLT